MTVARNIIFCLCYSFLSYSYPCKEISDMAIIVTLQNATFKETCFPFPLALMHETFQVGHIAGKEGEVR